ncbi:MAG: hypothetical protein C0485_13140 [Pirellula sp.]|nr:hypothetical protein [Pirellula sp.]
MPSASPRLCERHFYGKHREQSTPMRMKSLVSIENATGAKQWMQSIFVFLIAIPFAGVGVFMSGWVIRDLWTYSTIQSWDATPATLLGAKLEGERGRKRSSLRATARYRYEVDGKSYENDRVALHDMSDNIGGFQRERGEELERLLKEGKPVTAYVNPVNPTEAILFRDLRPGMLAFKATFALVFSAIGFGIIGGATMAAFGWGGKKQETQGPLPEPWLAKDAWRTGRIRTSAAPAWGALIMAGLWNLISMPVFYLAATDGDVEWYTLLVVGIFPLVGVALIAGTCYLWLLHWKWGVSEFEMAAVPGVLGGPLAGVIHVPRSIEAPEGIVIRLACVESKSDGEHTKVTTLWEEDRTIVRNLSTPGGAGTLIPVQFVIPYDLPDSDVKEVTWKLSAAAKTTGINYQSEFDVPVFKTESSSPTPSIVEIDDGKLFAPITLQSIAKGASAVLEEDLPDRKRLDFPMARQRGLSFGITFFTLIWIGVCVGLFYSDAPRFLAWLFSGIAVILLPIAVVTVLERTRLEFGSRGVKYTRRIAGFGSERAVASEEIASVTAAKSGVSSGATTYWKVELLERSGARHTLATAIPRRQLAERLAEEIAVGVGLSETRKDSEASRMKLESELPSELRAE